MGGKRSRNKGLSFERKVAIALRPIFPHARRHLEFQVEQARGVDLDETGEFRFQCKKMKKYAPISCLEEIEFEAMTIPVLVTAGDREPPVAVLPFEDFLNLLATYVRGHL